MYGRESAEHLLDTRLDERAPYTTGLSFSVAVRRRHRAAPWSSCDRRRDAPPVAGLAHHAAQPFRDPVVAQLLVAGHPVGARPRWAVHARPPAFAAPLYWRRGMCTLARVDRPVPAGRARR